MAQHIEYFRKHYDIIFFDTPPVFAVTDATLLGTKVDGVLIVIKAHHTDKEVAVRAVGTMAKVGVKIWGVVLNDINLTHRYASYGYYKYYYHYYKSKNRLIPMEPARLRTFNNGKHARGEWDTTILTYRKGPLRAAADFCSAKRRGVTHLADVAPQARLVLDAGTGNGAHTIWFLARRQCSVVCIDLSFEALRKIGPSHARSGAGGRALPVCADLATLPFKQNIFDAIFSVDTFGHVSDVNATLDELARTAALGIIAFLSQRMRRLQIPLARPGAYSAPGRDAPAELDGHQVLRLSADCSLCIPGDSDFIFC